MKLSSMPTSRHYVQSYASNDVSDSILREIVVSGDSRCVSEVRPNAYLVESKDVEALSGLYVSKLYQSGDADEIIVLPRICLRIQSETGIDELLKKYEVPSVKVTNASGIYRVDCDVPASDDVLNIIDKISRDKMVVWCEPDMM